MARPKLNLCDIISQIEEPLLLPNYVKWEILTWDLQKWNDVLGNEQLEFRCGLNTKSDNPQWEKCTPLSKGSFEDVLNFSSTDKWLYFDYKYLKDWLLKASELRENIHFEDLGFNNITVNESTIWIGTKGAHTPCHVDTYGCNIVVQVYGRKLWLLFDPNEDLKATRVPYEESTIYSKLNFFCPSNSQKFKDVQNGKLIILNPGDVLVIPNKWWHYVECLDNSISINTWLPLKKDHRERKLECILQFLMLTLLNSTEEKVQKYFLNPNSYNLLNQPYSETCTFIRKILKSKETQEESNEGDVNVKKLSDYLEENPSIRKIDTMSDEDLKKFLEMQSARFPEGPPNDFDDELEGILLLKQVTDVIANPDIMNMFLDKLLEE